jgi:alkanesulfonate monooxygenase SsuD/methylene tetrahydromethanopterin reductase-like flavin-dependent oxidoreductase (luciferase family)
VRHYKDSLPDNARAMLEHVLQASAIGTRDVVRDGLARFIARTQADEIIVSCAMFDFEARKRSLAIAAEAFAELTKVPA